MPISEDEYSQHSNDSIPSTTMSKAELRKTHKPIMEKRRRAKINNCLNEIKHLILVAMKKDPERHSKLEKADILEMAVKHLKSMQRQQRDLAIRTDPGLAFKYKSGFLECADEVTKYVDRLDGVDPAMKRRLSAHLMKCASGIDDHPFSSFGSSLLSYAKGIDDDQNNNAGKIEVIPSRLPTGEFAFVVPKSSFSNILLGDDRPSAFVTVTPKAEGLLKMSRPPLSPPMSPTSSDDPPPQRGFRPVIKSESYISSTTQIQSIKFPIHNVKKEPSEPLCVITNGGERYRQAQTLEETCTSAENVYEPPRKQRRVECDGERERPDGECSSMWRPW